MRTSIPILLALTTALSIFSAQVTLADAQTLQERFEQKGPDFVSFMKATGIVDVLASQTKDPSDVIEAIGQACIDISEEKKQRDVAWKQKCEDAAKIEKKWGLIIGVGLFTIHDIITDWLTEGLENRADLVNQAHRAAQDKQHIVNIFLSKRVLDQLDEKKSA